MDQLFAKLTNFSYELFGVFIPGLVTLIFLVIWWISLGPIAPYLSSGFFPHLQASNAAQLIESISVRTGIGIAFPTFIAAYFLGHMLHWIARSGKQNDIILKNSVSRVLESLAFRIPKPQSSFDEKLRPLFECVSKKFSHENESLEWVQFFPLAKNYLARNLNQSLVTNYQNKYTLHRSITLAGTTLFWLCVIAFIIGSLCFQTADIAPRWWILASLSAFSLATVWGFSDSYAYNWKLFGNTIITECYSMIFGPKDEKNSTSLVVVDVETSGINPFSNEVLAIALVPLDNNLRQKTIYVKHHNIKWSDFALDNFQKFRSDWEKFAVSPEEACNELEEYLENTFGGSVTIIGHNIGFDAAFLRRLAFQAGNDQIKGISHRALDTHTLLFALNLQGRIPDSALSSDGAFRFFDIHVEEKNRHTALGDALATKELFEKIIKEFM